MFYNPANPRMSNRKVPAGLTGAMGRFTGQPMTGSIGIVPFRKRIPDASNYSFRNPITGE